MIPAEYSELVFDREAELPQKLLPQFLVGDQTRLKQILINLVKNALKFTPRGFVRIVSSYDEDTEMLKIHIVDNGKGVRK